ncbi:MAG TPA: hypothetical protein VMR81_02380 [Patescibacteria group bacterium]|jgi:hypothetical protein|nr:hypothetical protein [Patescibacteria group bacterium]
MTISEADSYLPESRQLQDVFEIAQKTHFTIGTTLAEIQRAPFEKVSRATSDFITTSVAYFANRGHSELAQTIGTCAWRMINRKEVFPMYTENIPVVLHNYFEIPVNKILTMTAPGEPVSLIGVFPKTEINKVAGFIIFPPEFPLRVMTRPVEALATISSMASQITDYSNGRLYIDAPNIKLRAQAFEADFLLHARREIPDLELSPVFSPLLQLYPKGMESLVPKQRYNPNDNLPPISFVTLP